MVTFTISTVKFLLARNVLARFLTQQLLKKPFGCTNGKSGKPRLTGKKTKQSDKSEPNLNNQCRVCSSNTSEKGYLFRCSNQECGAVHWDKRYIKKNRKKLEEKEFFDSFLQEAGLKQFENGENFVYVLRLKGEVNAVYVGRTGLHPYVRFLNHIRGSNSARRTKSHATALISFEGPMSREASIAREIMLAKELVDEGLKVYGGH